MRFELDRRRVKCFSDSGVTYYITKDSCNCVGFGFRRRCRHFSEALREGWIAKLKSQTVHVSFRSSAIVESRKKAIRIFLEKRHASYTEETICSIEKILTQSTTSEIVLRLARNETLVS